MTERMSTAEDDADVTHQPIAEGDTWRVIPLDDRTGWEAALRSVPHAIAHTWGYTAEMHHTSQAPTGLLVCSSERGEYVCPVSFREFGGTTDLFTPSGFGGPVGRGDIAVFRRAWSELVATQAAVAGYLGLHPMLRPDELAADPAADAHGRCSVIDLDKPLEEVWDGMSQNPRRVLRRFQADAGPLETDRSILASAFVSIYGPFMEYKGAATSFEFADETLHGLCLLDDVLVIGYPEGEPRAVALFGATEHGAEYLYGVATPDARKYLVALIWHAIEHYVSRGVPWLSLGGGAPSLAEFKRRLGAYRVPILRLRQVYAPGEYERLCREAGVEPASDGFFPAYRSG